ncbi:hypothetical protein JXB12_03270 [candidate division KSB1 bacterium]|nr:hypothetical protein [candidate division KSB1 bacterium]
MNDIATRNNLYFDRLLNIFFHPNSYFSLCVAKNLNREILFDDTMGNGTSRIKRFLILKLIEANNTADELLHLSSLDDSIRLYDQLVNYMKHLDLSSREKAELKEAIADICSFFLNQLDQLLASQQMKEHFYSYLNLNGCNYPGNADVVTDSTNGKSISDMKPDNFSIADSELLDYYFKEEISNALAIVDPYDNGALKTVSNETFYLDWLTMSRDVKTVAIMNGQQEIEAIADRIYRLANILLAFKASLSDDIVGILKHGRRILARMINVDDDADNVLPLLESFDEFIITTEASLLQQTTNYRNNTISDADDDLPQSATDSEHEAEPASTEIDDDDPDEECKSGDFKIPGEDDPELLILIQEISNGKAKDDTELNSDEIRSSVNNIDADVSGVAYTPFDSSDILNNDDHSLDDDVADDIDVKIFLEESGAYFKLGKVSVTALIRDRYNESALENLELAASCLKSQTIKFGFEDISDIPRKIENLVTFSINQNIKLTPPILNTIQEAIQLLESVDHDSILLNRNHIIHKLNLHLHELNRLKNEHDVIYPQVY